MDQAAALCDARFAALSVEPGGFDLLKFVGPATLNSSPTLRPSTELAKVAAGRDAAAASGIHMGSSSNGGSYGSSESRLQGVLGSAGSTRINLGESSRRMSRALSLPPLLAEGEDPRKMQAEGPLQACNFPPDSHSDRPSMTSFGSGEQAPMRICRLDQAIGPPMTSFGLGEQAPMRICRQDQVFLGKQSKITNAAMQQAVMAIVIQNSERGHARRFAVNTASVLVHR